MKNVEKIGVWSAHLSVHFFGPDTTPGCHRMALPQSAVSSLSAQMDFLLSRLRGKSVQKWQAESARQRRWHSDVEKTSTTRPTSWPQNS